MANKFKVGDKVVGNDKANLNYNLTRKGWVGEVIYVIDDDYVAVRSEYSKNKFVVNSCYFDLLERKSEQESDQKIVITTDGKRTTAVLHYGKKRINEVSVVCHDNDTFDFMTGAVIACVRLSEEKKPERDLHYLLTDGIFGKERTSGLFVVVGDKMIYKSGGYDRIGSFNANLESSCSHIDEIYGDAISFDSIKYGSAKVIWKRGEKR